MRRAALQLDNGAFKRSPFQNRFFFGTAAGLVPAAEERREAVARGGAQRGPRLDGEEALHRPEHRLARRQLTISSEREQQI